MRWGIVRCVAFTSALIFGVPGAASASLTTTRVTIDGVVSDTVPAGSSVDLSVAVQTSGGSRVAAARIRIGSSDVCVPRARDGHFRVSAPTVPGTYDVSVIAAGSSGCRGTLAPAFVLRNGLRVSAPAPNPPLPQRCGTNVVLVLDKSGSIGRSADQVRAAARAFLESLSGTGSQVALIDFSSSAQLQVGYTPVTPSSIASTFEPYISGGYRSTGFTNWEDALRQVHEVNARKTADLVVFVTDGDPTAINVPGRPPRTGLPDGDAEAMRRAAIEADLVKQQGSHMLVVGVGAAVTKPESARRLGAISGFDEWTGGDDFADADTTLVRDFANLARSLRKIVTELCSPSLTVTKLVDEQDGRGFQPAAGWKVAADVRPSSGGYRWNQPESRAGDGPILAQTNADGVATFQWETDEPRAESAISMAEESRAGYETVDVQCVKRRDDPTSTEGGPDRLDVLGPEEFTTCTLRNRRLVPTARPGTPDPPLQPQQIVLVPPQSPVLEPGLVPTPTNAPGIATATPTPTPYLVPVLVPPLAPTPTLAPYLVPPLVPFAQPIPTPVLVPALVPPMDPPLKAPPLSPGQPTPPLIPIPIPPYKMPTLPSKPPARPVTQTATTPTPTPAPTATPTPTPAPAGTTPPNTVQTTVVGEPRLTVVKRVTRLVRPGQRIRFSLTVSNIGTETAHNVRVADLPPGSVALAALSASKRPRVVGGHYARWSLGDLAPGEQKTITGSVLLRSSSSGWHRNRAFASSTDTPTAHTSADTNVRRVPFRARACGAAARRC